MAKRKIYDWDAIEKEYRLGQKSLRTLTDEYGPTPGAISKKAKKLGWIQDKTKEVQEKTRAALLKETPQGNKEGNTPTPDDINRAVESNVRIIREHRTDIKNGRNMIDILSAQLKAAAENRDAISDDIYEETKAVDDNGKPDLRRRNAMMKAVSLPAHAGVLRDLSTALKNLIPLERQAFNIDSGGGGETIEDVIRGLCG